MSRRVNGPVASSFNACVSPTLLVCLASALPPWKVMVTGRVAVLSCARLVVLTGSLVFLGVAAVGNSLLAACSFGVAATLASTLVFCHGVSK